MNYHTFEIYHDFHQLPAIKLGRSAASKVYCNNDGSSSTVINPKAEQRTWTFLIIDKTGIAVEHLTVTRYHSEYVRYSEAKRAAKVRAMQLGYPRIECIN